LTHGKELTMAIRFKIHARAVIAAVKLCLSVGALLPAGCASKIIGAQPIVEGTQPNVDVATGVACGVGGAGGDGIATMGVGNALSQPVLSATAVTAADPPPPMSGGTLLVLRDGRTAVASDPDRDRIWIVDLQRAALTASVALAAHDEPGRLVEDGAGRVHVALRRGGALVTFDPQTGTLLFRRPVCAVPRGVAYDPSRDLVYVACMGGELVSLPAAGGAAVRTLSLESDLRDVVVDGSNLLISRFRSAEVLIVDAASGQVGGTLAMPGLLSPFVRQGAPFSASTAWRMMAAPGGGAVMLHQRGATGPIVAGPGGYGADPGGVPGLPGGCDTIVHPAMTPIKVGQACPVTPPIFGLVLAIDFALSADGSKTAVIAAGNSQNPGLQRLLVASTTDLTAPTGPTVSCGFGSGGGFGATTLDAAPGGGTTFVDASGVGGAMGALNVAAPNAALPDAATSSPGMPSVGTGDAGPPDAGPALTPQPTGEVEAVAFDGHDRMVVQTREPATLQMPELGVTIVLSTVSRADTGHAIFHANSGAGIACASCHAEGQEDGRVWEFDCLGPRRTMSISGGITSRAPYHWTGDLKDFPALMQEVYVGRMSGPSFQPDMLQATLRWVDSIPRLPPVVADSAAVTRGHGLFVDPAHGCVSCHNGPNLSNNALHDVGTGGTFKVPALTGLYWQAPYLHGGCAMTLADRFGGCGGGDKHGVTSNLSSADTADLIAYLQSL
jgi:hypothetical protein